MAKCRSKSQKMCRCYLTNKLPCVFLKIEKSDLIFQKSALILEKCVLFVWIYGLILISNTVLGASWRKKHQRKKCFTKNTFLLCVTHETFIEVCPSKKPPLPQKITYSPLVEEDLDTNKMKLLIYRGWWASLSKILVIRCAMINRTW